MRKLLLLPICVVMLFLSCKEYDFYDGEGKKPVYISYAALNDIRNLSPQPVEKTGTIFKQYDLFFMVERKKGIHVFNVGDSTNPVNLTFLKIPATNDFTLNGNILYADNGPRLVTIDISDLYNLQVLNIQKGAFQPVLFPPFYHGYFECADEEKGVVVDWEDAFLKNAKCEIPYY